MQKVVGSNPISRFFANPWQIGTLAFREIREIESNRPRFTLHFGHECPKWSRSEAIGADFARFALAFAPRLS
jgi:hypothetical protein